MHMRDCFLVPRLVDVLVRCVEESLHYVSPLTLTPLRADINQLIVLPWACTNTHTHTHTLTHMTDKMAVSFPVSVRSESLCLLAHLPAFELGLEMKVMDSALHDSSARVRAAAVRVLPGFIARIPPSNTYKGRRAEKTMAYLQQLSPLCQDPSVLVRESVAAVVSVLLCIHANPALPMSVALTHKRCHLLLARTRQHIHARADAAASPPPPLSLPPSLVTRVESMPAVVVH